MELLSVPAFRTFFLPRKSRVGFAPRLGETMVASGSRLGLMFSKSPKESVLEEKEEDLYEETAEDPLIDCDLLRDGDCFPQSSPSPHVIEFARVKIVLPGISLSESPTGRLPYLLSVLGGGGGDKPSGC